MKKLALLFAVVALAVSAIAQDVEYRLVAKMNGNLELENGSDVTFWGFGFAGNNPQAAKATLPAPILRATVGDSVYIHMFNASAEAHTIHLHGLDVDQVNDGVPTTSFMVPFNDSALYRFKATHAGTYLWHCHVTTTLHLTMGMYGLFIVKPQDSTKIYTDGPGYNRESSFLASEMDSSWNLQPTVVGTMFHMFDADYFMVNGLSGIQLFDGTDNMIVAQQGDSTCLRLANVGYSNVRYVLPEGLNAVVHMSDGRAIPTPMPVDSLDVGPGERSTLICKPTTTIEDYLMVRYLHPYNERLIGMNAIGVNTPHPIGVSELPEAESTLLPAPNPADGYVTVTANAANPWYLVDLNGRVAASGRLNAGSNRIDTQALPNGIYLLVAGNDVAKLAITHNARH